mmetsp:Transcript_26729/g.31536  ORF Transcript_26729/g.31536 Transcript_26729/m.31536 type:complete len:85 (+) Transcript_26729:1420-1674(+)
MMLHTAYLLRKSKVMIAVRRILETYYGFAAFRDKHSLRRAIFYYISELEEDFVSKRKRRFQTNKNIVNQQTQYNRQIPKKNARD